MDFTPNRPVPEERKLSDVGDEPKKSQSKEERITVSVTAKKPENADEQPEATVDKGVDDTVSAPEAHDDAPEQMENDSTQDALPPAPEAVDASDTPEDVSKNQTADKPAAFHDTTRQPLSSRTITRSQKMLLIAAIVVVLLGVLVGTIYAGMHSGKKSPDAKITPASTTASTPQSTPANATDNASLQTDLQDINSDMNSASNSQNDVGTALNDKANQIDVPTN